jgi:glyoxylate/hydroxypyruvate/2-ketogluconate reductase
MAPLSPETVKMIGVAQLALMKPGAIFINASRGATVDEAALIAALQAGRIRGAALDVFEQEPIAPDNPLLGLANVTLTPHIGSATHKTRVAMAMMAARNALEGAQGRQPPNVVPELQGLGL